MTLKEQIQTAFTEAFKTRQTARKDFLGLIRGEITAAEKNTRTENLSDSDITKILLKMKKSITDSLTLREDPRLREELTYLADFLPSEMSDSDIAGELTEILRALPPTLPPNAQVGKSMGEFNKRFPGRAEAGRVSAILKSLLG